MEVLDNPVWHTLAGRRAGFGAIMGDAASFDPVFAPFAAFAERADSSRFADLARLVGPGETAVVVSPELFAAGSGFESDQHGEGLQMTAPDLDAADDRDAVALGPDDAAEVLSLVESARPGPFGTRTLEFGGYLGLREDGELVAMAGERFQVPGFSEISAVCTHPAHVGRGFGTRIVRAVAARILARGETPILHVSTTNPRAIDLYLRLGFSVRRPMYFVPLTRPAVPA